MKCNRNERGRQRDAKQTNTSPYFYFQGLLWCDCDVIHKPNNSDNLEHESVMLKGGGGI